MAVPVFIARLWSGLCGPLCANGTKNEDLVLLLPICCAFVQQPAQPANQPDLSTGRLLATLGLKSKART